MSVSASWKSGLIHWISATIREAGAGNTPITARCAEPYSVCSKIDLAIKRLLEGKARRGTLCL